MLLLRLVLVLVFVVAQVVGIRIGAFNIRSFGRTKLNNTDVMLQIDGILRRYDVVLVQEIVDSTNTVIPGVLSRLRSNGESWNVAASGRLGRTTYKEQYAYFYRSDKVGVESTYQYPDVGDEFSRPPYGILVNSDRTGDLKKFVLLGVHVAPYQAVAEVNALVNVISAVKSHWGIQDVMVMGDFNADCSYMNSEQRANLLLRTDTSYMWLIEDGIDTTVSTTICTYDRMVMSGDLFQAAVVPNSAKTFEFDTELSPQEAMAISDHYPVEVRLCSRSSYRRSQLSRSLLWYLMHRGTKRMRLM